MNLPKISIVTPSYNQGKHIEQTIQSVIDQNYPNLEYIIIDGGSIDETVAIIKKYEEHLSYWVTEPDAGQTDAINKGFAKCTGDIFNWINSDDYYEPGVFHKLSQLFSNDSSVQVVCGKEWGFDDTNLSEKIFHPGSVIKEHVFETIRVGIIDQPCTFFRRKTIEPFFPLDISLRYVMDKQLWWSYLLKYGQHNILQTDTVITHFRLHNQSKSMTEGNRFENEFDQLKLSLFRQLNAPVYLQKLLDVDDLPAFKTFQIDIQPSNFILAAFALFYAEKKYIHTDLKNAAFLMGYVKKWKGYQMNKKEWKLWILTVLVPHKALTFLKKIRG